MYSAEQRQEIVATVLAELSKGTPLTIICNKPGMPGTSTVYEWIAADEVLSGRIARARETGFDQIAMDALAIADHVGPEDSIETEHGAIPNKEWLMRSKLRVETRIKLLSKWDPKRYGDMMKHAGADGENLKLTVSSEDARA